MMPKLALLPPILVTTTSCALIGFGEASATNLLSLDLLGRFDSSYYIGFVLLTLTLGWYISREGGSGLQPWVLISGLFTALYIEPMIIGGTPTMGHSYSFWLAVQAIQTSAHISPSTGPWFLYWPGMETTFATIADLTGIGSYIISVTPILWQGLLLLIVILISRTFSGSKKLAITAAWLFLVTDWVDQATFSDQAYGIFLLSVLILILAKNFGSGREGKGGTTLLLTVTVLIAGLVLTHILTTIIAIVMVGFIVLRYRALVKVFLASVIMFAAWNGFWALQRVAFSIETLGIPTISFNFFRENLVQKVSGGATSASHLIATRLELISVLVFFAIGFYGWYVSSSHTKFPVSKSVSFVLVCLVISTILVSVLIGNWAGGEIVERAYFFSLLSLPIFGATFSSTKNLFFVLLFFLLFSGCLNVYFQYNTNPVNHLNPGELQSNRYFETYAQSGEVYGNVGSYLSDGGLFVSSNGRLFLTQPQSFNGTIVASLAGNSYIGISSTDVNTYIYANGGSPKEVASFLNTLSTYPGLNLAFNNPDSLVFVTSQQ